MALLHCYIVELGRKLGCIFFELVFSFGLWLSINQIKHIFVPPFICFQSGGGIHEFADSQFGMQNLTPWIFLFAICIGPYVWKITLFITGHVFAYGVSRAAAITNMSLALKEIQIRGEIHSNVDYTVDLLNVRNTTCILNPCFWCNTTILHLAFL